MNILQRIPIERREKRAMKPYQNPICLFVAIPAEDLIRTSTGLTNAGVGNANSLQGYSFNDFLNQKS